MIRWPAIRRMRASFQGDGSTDGCLPGSGAVVGCGDGVVFDDEAAVDDEVNEFDVNVREPVEEVSPLHSRSLRCELCALTTSAKYHSVPCAKYRVPGQVPIPGIAGFIRCLVLVI
jgi:hypothetical protein